MGVLVLPVACRALLASCRRLGLDADALLRRAGLSPAELELAAEMSRPRRFAAGEVVFEEGELGDALFVIGSGEIEVLCPFSASFELSAKTVKGKLENTFLLTPKRHASTPFASSNSLLGTHNTGSATVELTSFSGRIRVRPQP